MKPGQRKKASGTQGRKRRKDQDAEYAKSSKILTAFFKRGENPDASTSKSLQDAMRVTADGSTERLEHLEEICSSDTDSGQPDIDKMEYQGLLHSEEDSKDDLPHPVPQDKAECAKIVPDVIHHRDFGYLKFDQTSGKAVVSDALRLEIVERGSVYFQNCPDPFTQRKKRSMPSEWFLKPVGKDGYTVSRSWLVYSPVKDAAFCFSCLLFPSKDTDSSSLESENGFSNWKKLDYITSHEKSQRHRNSFITWKDMDVRLKAKLVSQPQNVVSKEKEEWRQVLQRFLSCIKCLCKQDLALRGHSESISKTGNTGDLMEFLKLLAEYDPVMKGHLLYEQQPPGTTSYISPQIQDEFIQVLASTVRGKLLFDIQRAKYYGILFDSSPDAAHQEQMPEIIRYVDINNSNKTVAVKESFLGFIKTHRKDAASIADIILQQLEKDAIPFEDCRSLCYDNASVMSGFKSEVQQRLSSLNSKAVFVNCDIRTLNLVGVHAVSHEPEGVTFFGTVQAIYLFFSQSALLWERLKTAVGVTVKSESETRWSSRIEAIKPIHDHLEHLVELLENTAEDQDENSYTRSNTSQLLLRILTFEFFVLLRFWNTVLAKIDQVQKRLQDHTMNFHDAAQDIQALHGYFIENSDAICKNSVQEAKVLCSSCDVQVERWQRKRKRMPGETAEDVGLTAETEMLQLMKSMIDRICTEMGDKFISVKKLDSSFGFLLDTKELICTTDINSLKQRCISLGSFYESDIDGLEMFNEIMDCRMLLKPRAEVKLSTPEDLLHFTVQYGDNVFPNLRVGLQILLTVAASIASCERSFSKLNLVRSYFATSTGQESLSALALLSVEQEVINTINVEAVIDKFATMKARKISL